MKFVYMLLFEVYRFQDLEFWSVRILRFSVYGLHVVCLRRIGRSEGVERWWMKCMKLKDSAIKIAKKWFRQ